MFYFQFKKYGHFFELFNTLNIKALQTKLVIFLGRSLVVRSYTTPYKHNCTYPFTQNDFSLYFKYERNKIKIRKKGKRKE